MKRRSAVILSVLSLGLAAPAAAQSRRGRNKPAPAENPLPAEDQALLKEAARRYFDFSQRMTQFHAELKNGSFNSPYSIRVDEVPPMSHGDVYRRWNWPERVDWHLKKAEHMAGKVAALEADLARLKERFGATEDAIAGRLRDEYLKGDNARLALRVFDMQEVVENYTFSFQVWRMIPDLEQDLAGFKKWKSWVPGAVVKKAREVMAADRPGDKRFVEGRVFHLKSLLGSLDTAFQWVDDDSEKEACAAELEAKIAEVEKSELAVLEAYDWGPTVPSQWTGDNPAEACLTFFKKAWNDERLLAVRVYEPWWSYKRVSGTTTQWAVRFELAYPYEEDSSLVKLTNVTCFTADERLGIAKKPPFLEYCPRDKSGVGEVWYAGDGGIIADPWYLMKKDKLNEALARDLAQAEAAGKSEELKGLLSESVGKSGGGSLKMALGIILGMGCCFIFVLGAGIGGFVIYKRTQTSKAEA